MKWDVVTSGSCYAEHRLYLDVDMNHSFIGTGDYVLMCCPVGIHADRSKDYREEQQGRPRACLGGMTYVIMLKECIHFSDGAEFMLFEVKKVSLRHGNIALRNSECLGAMHLYEATRWRIRQA